MRLSRRSILGGGVTIASVATGCISFGSSYRGGEVVVRNDSGSGRTVEMTTSKIHEEERRPDSDPDDETPPASHLLERNETFQIPSGEIRSSTELIPEPGTYHIYAVDDRGEGTAVEYGFYPAGVDGESPGGGFVSVSVEEPDHEPAIQITVVGSD